MCAVSCLKSSSLNPLVSVVPPSMALWYNMHAARSKQRAQSPARIVVSGQG